MKKIILMIMMMLSMLHADIFMKGNKTVGVTLGSGSVNYGRFHGTENYTILGISGSYFVMDALSVGLGYRHWFGGSPSIDEVTVPVTYYLPLESKFRPYAGGFVRQVFMGDGYDDDTVYGVRGGLTVKMSSQSYLGVGWVQEYYSDCSGRDECSSGYPELLFSLSF